MVSAALRFLDDSTFNIGEKSTVVLDSFVYDPDRGSLGAVFNLAKGTMRFISGGRRTRDATIQTPVGVVGIRGPDMMVICNDGPECAAVMRSGRARICPVPDGTTVGPELRGACIRSDMARLPCGFFEIAAADARKDRTEGNFSILRANCAAVVGTVAAATFGLLAKQVAAGAPVSGSSQIATLASATTTPATATAGVASATTTAAGAATGAAATTAGVSVVAAGAGVAVATTAAVAAVNETLKGGPTVEPGETVSP